MTKSAAPQTNRGLSPTSMLHHSKAATTAHTIPLQPMRIMAARSAAPSVFQPSCAKVHAMANKRAPENAAGLHASSGHGQDRTPSTTKCRPIAAGSKRGNTKLGGNSTPDNSEAWTAAAGPINMICPRSSSELPPSTGEMNEARPNCSTAWPMHRTKLRANAADQVPHCTRRCRRNSAPSHSRSPNTAHPLLERASTAAWRGLTSRVSATP
mmetsp:Transcript_98922/g.251111  ORF Transcript_98922/g.251111 Transcript_98922/m.251111 type:complete len:211 (+) Transcript_98922:226-858(+)